MLVATGEGLLDAIDSLRGRREQIMLVGRPTFDEPVDVKRAVIVGEGVPGNSGGGGTMVTFGGTAGFFSSMQDNFGYELRDLDIVGSAGPSPNRNGQTLVDFTGQNSPRLANVRLRRAETGMLLANGATVDCHYGRFYGIDAQQCVRAVHVADGAHSHQWFGGRWWACATAGLIDAANNIGFHGVAFEAHTTAGVDSAGSNVSTVGCRFEAQSSSVKNLTAHGTPGVHYCFGDHWSTGIDPTDQSYDGPPVCGLVKGRLLGVT